MKKFEFSSNHVVPEQIFSGKLFYNVYKDAEFLRHSDNIETILAKGYQLRKTLKETKPGELVKVDGMYLERNTPLLIKKTGPNVQIENFEFTANRLNGLVAAYAFENRLRFPILNSSEASALGLKWDNKNEIKCRLFLSSVSGTEHFYDQFRYYPLLCALRKLQLNKITLEPVIKIAKIKNTQGERMAKELLRNHLEVNQLLKHFPGALKFNLKMQLCTAPPELKKFFLEP
ncbi:uncharacterized protein LOC123658985 [Melitaea cinxia]|uniref:uncharacterized protein LOC123658985 n=1 Tax=Melitaea cinxia TaxID=113334 RepID=UPI001E274AE7|nr:uncharacterized protein LOC123658985 [Melitaea cinxia]